VKLLVSRRGHCLLTENGTGSAYNLKLFVFLPRRIIGCHSYQDFAGDNTAA
jgi:hypothetical protein